MRNIFRYIVCACLALALGGCIKDEIVGNSFCREGLLSLNIGINETRAAGDNDNGDADLTLYQLPLNENRIDDYEVFLFASGATGEAKFSTYVSGVNATDSTTNNAISVPAGALAELFDSGNTCNIYVVANLGKSLASELKNASTPLTLANLKAHIVSANFATPEVIEGQDHSEYNSAPIQPNFVMDSSGTDTVTKDGNNLTGEVYITRAASKISFMAYIGQSMTIDGKVWIPDLANIKVAFNNVVEKGAIDNGSDTEDTFTMPQVDSLYNNLSGVQLILEDKTYTQTPEFEGNVQGVSNWSKLDIVVPFYTYSSIWNANEKKVNPSIVLTVPWFVKDNKTTTLTNYNYTIPLTAADGDLKLVRNKHYRIALRVGVLGDLDQLASSEFSYEVLGWVGNDIMVDLSDPKYLVVDKTFVEMDNVEEILIPYHSSDDCIITGVTCKRDDVLNGTEASLEDWGEAFTYDLVEIEGKTYIKFTNDLDNNLFNSNGSFNDAFDFGKYTISLTISHKNADGTASTKYTEDVKIIQYPAIYGERKVNSDYANDSSHYGYAFVNGENDGTNPSYSQFCGIAGSPSGSGVNSNSMYVVTVSSVKGTNYVIGDPRTRTPLLPTSRTGGNFTYVSAPTTYTTTNQSLTNYYPAQRDLTMGANHPTYNMVAPKFRICSGYGAIDSSTSNRQYLQNVEGRCATYQEDGYPAGRWRLPTRAELELIYTLCEEEKLPDLFADIPYWCAHGYGSYNNGSFVPTANANQGSSSVSVRCVYDEWYWGSEQIKDKSTFTWGDEPRQ